MVELSQGRRLGTYQILAPLGAGGMGEVYRAKDLNLGRDVAVGRRRRTPLSPLRVTDGARSHALSVGRAPQPGRATRPGCGCTCSGSVAAVPPGPLDPGAVDVAVEAALVEA